MKRRLLNLLTDLSLLLCVAVATAWGLSYADYSIDSADGRFLFALSTGGTGEEVTPSNYPGGKRHMWSNLMASTTWQRSVLGLKISRGTVRWDDLGGGPAATIWLLQVPYWMILCVVIVLPLARLTVWMVRRRGSLGRCRACGYDLRGNESGTCPECGTVAATTE